MRVLEEILILSFFIFKEVNNADHIINMRYWSCLFINRIHIIKSVEGE